jgi:hypothetical protein
MAPRDLPPELMDGYTMGGRIRLVKILPPMLTIFPSCIVQSAVTNYVSYTFSSCFTFVRVFCRIVCACFTFSRYDFSFDHVFRVHLTF